jgi:hypothetical protein
LDDEVFGLERREHDDLDGVEVVDGGDLLGGLDAVHLGYPDVQ